MDVVALAQNGVEYAVATLGTATSATHLQKLLRQTDEVVFCFDSDAAGRKAAWHAIEVRLPHLADNKAMRFLFLPPEHDPDSFVREKGKEAFEKMLETARPLSEFFVEELMGRVELKRYEGRAQLVHEAKPMLKQISARTLQRQLIQMIAATGYLDKGQAAQLTQELTEARLAAPASGLHRGAQAPELRLVRIILQCLISKPALAKELSAELLDQDSPEARALAAIAEFCRENPDTDGNIVIDHFQGTEFRHLLESNQAALLNTKLDAEDMEVDFRGALEQLRDKRRQQRFEALRVKPGRTPDEEAEMLRLLRERNLGTVSASNNATISGSRPIS